MTVPYLNELLSVRCEDVLDVIAKMRRVGVPDERDYYGEFYINKMELLLPFCVRHFRVSDKGGAKPQEAAHD